MVKRGAMKKDHSYFESIEQAEQIKEAEQKILETQTRAMEALQKQLEKLDYDMKQIQKKIQMVIICFKWWVHQLRF